MSCMYCTLAANAHLIFSTQETIKQDLYWNSECFGLICFFTVFVHVHCCDMHMCTAVLFPSQSSFDTH